MGARKHHGIHAALYGTAFPAATAINNIDASNSSITFPDQEDNPVDAYGGQYRGVPYAEVTIRALDMTAFNAIDGHWKTDTRLFFKLTLDGGEQWEISPTDTMGVRPTSVKPVEVQGQAKGRADAFDLVIRYPYDQINKVTS